MYEFYSQVFYINCSGTIRNWLLMSFLAIYINLRPFEFALKNYLPFSFLKTNDPPLKFPSKIIKANFIKLLISWCIVQSLQFPNKRSQLFNTNNNIFPCKNFFWTTRNHTACQKINFIKISFQQAYLLSNKWTIKCIISAACILMIYINRKCNCVIEIGKETI